MYAWEALAQYKTSFMCGWSNWPFSCCATIALESNDVWHTIRGENYQTMGRSWFSRKGPTDWLQGNGYVVICFRYLRLLFISPSITRVSPTDWLERKNFLGEQKCVQNLQLEITQVMHFDSNVNYSSHFVKSGNNSQIWGSLKSQHFWRKVWTTTGI